MSLHSTACIHLSIWIPFSSAMSVIVAEFRFDDRIQVSVFVAAADALSSLLIKTLQREYMQGTPANN